MLDRTSRKLLKLITTDKAPTPDHLFTFDYVMDKLSISKNEAFACIRFLDSQGYLRCVYLDFDGVDSLYGFEASHKGYHYAEFWAIGLFEELAKSVLLPVVVSIITAIIVAA